MTHSRDLVHYESVARLANYFGGGFGPGYTGPRPGKEPPDDPTPGDHGPDPDEPLDENESAPDW